MVDRTPDATPTIDLGPGADDRREPVAVPSAFDPPAARFDTIGEIGRGGMGRVDDAFDRALGRPVAIKHMLSPSKVDLARFEREARITARLEHPGIVPIHDAGRGPDGTPYYVMRRVDGRPLDALVTEKLADRLALIPNVLAACDAVAFAHARGIIHRDIKPTNILVGPFGETLVIDWGLAREIGEADAAPAMIPSDPQLTRAGTVAGTPGFMAPEQARGEAVDARADVFALGATLFFVLSGQLPYDTASATEMVDLAGAGRAPNWKVVPDDVPADLRAIAIKAMASDAAERYADASALAADLRRFITGNLVGAYDYNWSSRLLRFMRRHRAAVAIALVSAVLLIGGATLSVRRILAERDDARAARDDATSARELAETRQHDATAMADRLLVTHARELADSDPLAAIMALRRLAPESTRWHDAWVAAAAAWVHGISFGLQHDSNSTYVEVNAHGKAFALYGTEGHLVVTDLVARTERVVAAVGWGNQAHWLGPQTIALIRAGHLRIVDTSTGAIRTLELAAVDMFGDHDSKVWIQTPDHRVIELTGPDAEPRELMTGIDAIDPARDLSKAVVRRGRRLELWSPTGSLFIMDLPTARTFKRVSFGANDVALFDDHERRSWELVDGHLVERFRVQDRHTSVISAGGSTFIHDLKSASISVLADDGSTTGTPLNNIAGYFETRPGLVALDGNGGLHLFDNDNWFTLGPSALRFLRADMSPDRRFVIASASNGDFVWWDLSLNRPTHIALLPGEQVADVTAHFLWTSQGDQLHRIDLATKQREAVLPFAGWAPGGFIVDPDERFAWAYSSTRKQVRLYDATTNQVHDIAGTTLAASSPIGVTTVGADGELWRWRPGDADPRSIGSFHQPVDDLAVQDHFAVGFAKPNTLLRLDLDHGTSETTHLEPTSYAVSPKGRAWIASATKLWRWDRGQQPVLLPLADPPVAVFMSGDRAVIHAQHALIEILDGPPHAISIEVKQLAWRNDASSFATVSAQDTVGVVDRVSGLGFTLGKIMTTGSIAANRHTVAFIDRFVHVRGGGGYPTVEIWTITVPEDPVALRAWLGTVTNARSVVDTDAHSWPQN